MENNKSLKQMLSSCETYPQTKEIKFKVLYGDKNLIISLLQSLAGFISDEQEQPIVRLLALKLNKELVETFNEDYISLVQKDILHIMERIAKYELTCHDADRGKTYFLINQSFNQSNKNLQVAGEQFLRLTLECIWVWSKWFPMDKRKHRLSCFKVVVEKLNRMGVKFPKLSFFEVEQVWKYLPSYMIPLNMVVQLRELLEYQGNMTTKEVCKYLSKHSASEHYVCKHVSYGEWLKSAVNQKHKSITQHSQPSIKRLNTIKAVASNEESFEDLPSQKRNSLLQEKQQMQTLTAFYQQKNNELAKQLMLLQQQMTEVQKERDDKQNMIEALQNQILSLRQTIDENSKQEIRQKGDDNKLKKQYRRLQTQQELEDLRIACFRLQSDNKVMSQQLAHLQSQFDVVDREKMEKQFENQRLINQLNIQQRNKTFNSKQDVSQQRIPLGDKIKELQEYQSKLIDQRANLIQFEVSNIQLKAQLFMIKDGLQQIDKLNLSTSNNSIRTIPMNSSNIQSYQGPSQQTGSDKQSKQSKHILSTQFEYNPMIFAIHPQAFNIRFRQGCITQKCILHSDDNIQLGVQTQLKTQVLHISLLITNRTKSHITDIKLNQKDNKDLQVLTQFVDFQSSLKPGESGIIKFQVQIVHVPYFLLEAALSYLINNTQCLHNICLPSTINKYFNYCQNPQHPQLIFLYSSKPFPTGLQNQISALFPEFTVNLHNESEIDIVQWVELENRYFMLNIHCKKSIMQIKIKGDIQEKYAETVISTIQGLFLKR